MEKCMYSNDSCQDCPNKKECKETNCPKEKGLEELFNEYFRERK